MHHAVGWQRIEGGIIFLAGLALVWHLDSGLPWWTLVPLFFAPDLSFLTYGLGPRIGAFGYNLVHIYASGIVLLVLGLVLSIPLLAALGALWVSHCGFDRLAGYGLKSSEGFSVTHLGVIGKKSHR